MDKNKIHIDDFVRNMLSDREEEKPAGAWGGMRQLLDRAMPVAGTVAGAAFNWKRFLGIASVVVAIGGLSLGGYELMDEPKAGQQGSTAAVAVSSPDHPGAATQNPATPAGTKNSGAAGRGAVSGPAAAGAGASTDSRTASSIAGSTGGTHESGASTAAATSANRSGRSSAAAGARPDISHAASSHPAARASSATTEGTGGLAETTTDRRTSRPDQSVGNDSRAAGHRASSHTAVVAGAGAAPDAGSLSEHEAGSTDRHSTANHRHNGGAAGSGQQSAAAGHGPASLPSNATAGRTAHRGEHDDATGSAATSSFHASHSSANQQLGASGIAASRNSRSGAAHQPTAGGRPRNQHPSGTLTGTEVDSITVNYVETHQYPDPQSRAWRMDTIGIYQIQHAVPRQEPVEQPQSEPAPQQRRNTPPKRSYGPNPDAAAYLPAASSTLAAVQASKSAVKKTGDMYEKEGGISLAATIDRTRSAFSQIRWQPGLIGAFSTTFGRNSFLGFQLGLSSLFLVNEKWSFGLEAKYSQLANRGTIVKDDYLSTVEAGTNRWIEDTVSHFFNFSSTQAIQVPLFLRREIGRFFAMAGVNFTYAFSVNAEEREQRRGTTTIITGYLPPNTNLGLQRSPSVVYQDFNRRFGFGYTFGAGYAITPALQADVRMTQMVWDNAAGTGSQRVSKELYRAPSMQISISYRFNAGRD